MVSSYHICGHTIPYRTVLYSGGKKPSRSPVYHDSWFNLLKRERFRHSLQSQTFYVCSTLRAMDMQDIPTWTFVTMIPNDFVTVRSGAPRALATIRSTKEDIARHLLHTGKSRDDEKLANDNEITAPRVQVQVHETMIEKHIWTSPGAGADDTIERSLQVLFRRSFFFGVFIGASGTLLTVTAQLLRVWIPFTSTFTNVVNRKQLGVEDKVFYSRYISSLDYIVLKMILIIRMG